MELSAFSFKTLWQEATKAVGYVMNGLVQGSQVAANQRTTLNQQNNAWNLGVINSGSKNYAFLGIGAVIIIILIVIISKYGNKHS